MINLFKKFLIIFFIFFISNSASFADVPYFVDFKLILNKSDAGKKAQDGLKQKLENGFKSLKQKEKAIQDEEKKLIEQKKIISSEEYKSQVKKLRGKVVSLQKERNTLVNTVAKQRSKARNELLKNLNPIIKEYMIEKQVRLVIDSKNVILGDEKLDITKDIMSILNKNLKSIKLN